VGAFFYFAILESGIDLLRPGVAQVKKKYCSKNRRENDIQKISSFPI